MFVFFLCFSVAEDLENEFFHANEDDINEKDSLIKIRPRTFSTSSMRKNKYTIHQQVSVISTDDKKNKDKVNMAFNIFQAYQYFTIYRC